MNDNEETEMTPVQTALKAMSDEDLEALQSATQDECRGRARKWANNFLLNLTGDEPPEWWVEACSMGPAKRTVYLRDTLGISVWKAMEIANVIPKIKLPK